MKIFDFLSPQVYLYSFNNKKHQTHLGGILFILIVIIGFGFSIYFSLDLYIRSNPKSSYLIEKFESDVGEINMNTSGIFHYVFLVNLLNFTIMEINPKIFHVEGILTSVDNNINIRYSYDNCNKTSYLNDLSDYLPNGLINRSLCLYSQYINQTIRTINDNSFEPPILKHGVRSLAKPGNFYRVFIKKCLNSTQNNFYCLPQNDIDNYFNNVVLNFEFMDNYFDVTNYTNPINKYIYGVKEILSKDNYVRNSINLQRVRMVTNKGIIFDEKEEINSFSFEQNEKAVIKKENDDKLIISEVSFYLQNFVKVYERSYIKLQDVLANIGGFIKMLTLISSVLNYNFFRFRLLQNSYFVINNYLDNYNDLSNKKNVCEISKEKTNNYVSDLNILNLEKIDNTKNKNFREKKVNLYFMKYLFSYFKCKVNRIYCELEKFRNHILNEATIYELKKIIILCTEPKYRI